jgi:hypothetical protein
VLLDQAALLDRVPAWAMVQAGEVGKLIHA